MSNLFENLQLYNENDNWSDKNGKVYQICKKVRDELISKYGEDFLYGKCIEASDKIIELLKDVGIDANYVEGYCIYDDDSGCTDRPYDEHTWVELVDGTYIDVTATQFQSFIYDNIPEIIIGDKPNYMVYNVDDDDYDDYDYEDDEY